MADVIDIADARRKRELRREGIAALLIGAALGLWWWFAHRGERT
jgi:hypothetical protein